MSIPPKDNLGAVSAPDGSGSGGQSDRDNTDYEIGRGKPPKAYQFKKGVSGNPKGRKKNKQIDDIRDVTDPILEETVPVHDGKRVRSVSKLEAAILALRRQALLGNPKAARKFFSLAAKAGMLSKVPQQSFVKLMQRGGDDGKVIRMFHAEQEELARARQKANRDTDGVNTSRRETCDTEREQ